MPDYSRWAEWNAIEAAQSAVDRPNVVPFPKSPQDAPEPPAEPAEAVTAGGRPYDGVPGYEYRNGQPTWVGIPREREPVDDATGLRLLAKMLRGRLHK